MGRIEFLILSDLAAPYIFELQQETYTLKIKRTSMIKSKYTMIMLKLIELKTIRDRNTIIVEGTVEEFGRMVVPRERKVKN